MSRDNRLFEYRGFWLVDRPDTDKFYIAWWPDDAGTRRIRRVSTGTADIAEARQRLMEHANRHAPLSQEPTADGLPHSTAPSLVPAATPLAAAPSLSVRYEWSSAGASRATLAQVTHEPPLLILLTDYVDRLRDSASYRNAELFILRHWTEFCEQNSIVYPAELTFDVQEQFVQWRRASIVARKGSCSNGTIIRDLGVLKAALRYACQRRRLAAVPHFMTLASPRARQRYLTLDEVLRLLDACDQPHLRMFVLLALHTLQRPAAILELQTSQIDLDRGVIDFLAPGRTQTKKGRPVVPISQTLRPDLEWAIETSSSGYVIEWNELPVKSIKTAFAGAVRRAQLRDCSPYTLRHSGATHLVAAGVPMRQVAGFLGHSTEKTTEIYAKHSPDFLQDASAALDNLFGTQLRARETDLRASAPEMRASHTSSATSNSPAIIQPAKSRVAA